jgi:MtN3 and saliva related transmembrane protein
MDQTLFVTVIRMTGNATNKAAWLRYFEISMLMMGIIGPLATAPQLIKLYFTHSHHAQGLSLSSWIAYSLLALLWFLYGLVHKNAPIWVGNLIGLVMDILMVIGILIHAGITF